MIIRTLDGATNNRFYLKMGGKKVEENVINLGGKDYSGTGFIFSLDKIFMK